VPFKCNVRRYSPAKNGLVTFTAFVVFGIIPLMPYVLGGATKASDEVNFIVACVLTVGLHSLPGGVRLVTRTHTGCHQF
jgi:hypothetical protein